MTDPTVLAHAVVYDPDTGRILRAVSGPEPRLQAQALPGEALALGRGLDTTHYVLDGEVTERPACPATLDGTTLRNLPLPCTVVIDNDEHQLEEGDDDFAELEFTYSGTYKVQVLAWPHQDATFEVVQA